ncbi:MAG: C40 family peptidase [Alphaproteobacteria bacterium]|nr:C40 family peptidase [Alphaproteobacteria bacterium]
MIAIMVSQTPPSVFAQSVGQGSEGDNQALLNDCAAQVYAGNITFDEIEAGWRQCLLDAALGMQGVPYAWGGKDPATGVDCSGFTYSAFLNAFGVSIGDSTWSQPNGHVLINGTLYRNVGDTYAGGEIGDYPVGTILFFVSDAGERHVVMAAGNGQIIDAGQTLGQVALRNIPDNLRNDYQFVGAVDFITPDFLAAVDRALGTQRQMG